MTEKYKRRRLKLLDAGATLVVGDSAIHSWREARFKHEPGPEVREMARAAGYVVIVEKEQDK